MKYRLQNEFNKIHRCVIVVIKDDVPHARTLCLYPILVEEIERIVLALAADGIAILLAEQNAAMALGVSHRAYVLESGRISLEGPAAALKETAEVRTLYLGS